MNNINGYDNEYEFVKYFNHKKINELNPLAKDFIVQLYGELNQNFEIKAWRNHLPQKIDIFIEINNSLKGISIKKGMKNSIHVERITDFIHFLIENKIKKKTIINYLKYHYADGTTNGRGIKRLSIEEYKKNHQNEIDEINKEFNNPILLEKIVEKFITKGNNSKYHIDAIIYGEVNSFIWILKKDIKKIILSKKDIYSTAVHFGPLTCQPKNRCLNYNPIYEKDRFCVQIKWYNLFDDILEYKNNKLLNDNTNL